MNHLRMVLFPPFVSVAQVIGFSRFDPPSRAVALMQAIITAQVFHVDIVLMEMPAGRTDRDVVVPDERPDEFAVGHVLSLLLVAI